MNCCKIYDVIKITNFKDNECQMFLNIDANIENNVTIIKSVQFYMEGQKHFNE